MTYSNLISEKLRILTNNKYCCPSANLRLEINVGYKTFQMHHYGTVGNMNHTMFLNNNSAIFV